MGGLVTKQEGYFLRMDTEEKSAVFATETNVANF